MRWLLVSTLLCVACGGSSESADAAADAHVRDAPVDLAEDAPGPVGDLLGDGEGKGLSISPLLHDYARVPIGAMSEVFIFTVTNTGRVALSPLELTLEGKEFAATILGNRCASVPELAPSARCTVEVVFEPVSRGMKQGTLSASAGSLTATANLTGIGDTNEPSIVIQPPSATLESVVGQTGPPMTFTIVNLGDTTTVQVALTGANADQFQLANSCALLPADGSCTIPVSLAPTSAGMKTATLTARGAVGLMGVATLTGLAHNP